MTATWNATIQWTMASHSLITTYQSITTPWHIKSIIRDLLLTLGLDAFVDDTNMIHADIGDSDIHELLQIIQNNLRSWQGLLHASGGTLNLPKCSWTPIIWTYNHLGHACMAQLPVDPGLQLYAKDLSGQRHHL